MIANAALLIAESVCVVTGMWIVDLSDLGSVLFLVGGVKT
jgi:hypothetical protein